MASHAPNLVRNSLGIVVPADIDAIVKDYNRHPERGRLLDRINEHSRRNNNEAPAAKKQRRAERNKGHKTAQKLAFRSCSDGGMPKIEGTIGIWCGDKLDKNVCSDYLVYASEHRDGDLALILLHHPEKGSIPCVCATSLLDASAIEAIKKSSKQHYGQRKALNWSSMRNLTIQSVPISRGGR